MTNQTTILTCSCGDDVPNPATHTFSFYAKLFRAWAAMGFRTPKVDFINGDIDVQ